MKTHSRSALSFLLLTSFAVVHAAETYDIVIYGSSPAAISAAVQARRMGKTCVIVSPETRIGGLTTGGLGQTDIGNKQAFGGIALEFYRDVARHYRDAANWKWQKRGDYLPDGQCAGTKGTDSMWTFEPSAALKILEGWEKRDGLVIRRGKRLDRTPGKVKVQGEGERRRIVSFVTEDGAAFCGKMFVDATYEGDLMAAAGVSYTVGREANAQYGETLNGTQVAHAKCHQFVNGVDPYVVAGDPTSGILPGVEPGPVEPDGTGDRRVQAYCFRMCLTDVPENRIPFAKPAGYDERAYELLFRHLAVLQKTLAGKSKWPMPWINSKMPNRKTDTNNRDAFSTDFIGRNWNWPEASYAEREEIRKAHLAYQRGLMWTLANHPRVPEAVRREVSRWGLCRDEFADGLGDGWQTQLYVREARRMVGDYVMSEANCTGRRIAPRPVAMAAYQMDSHNVRRYVGKDGFVHNEGDVEVSVGGRPFPIDYGAIVPQKNECANLFVPVCLSASHIAFGSIRMEPVFFALGQAAATAASQAIDADCAAQDLAYGPLAARLRADGQVFVLDEPPTEVVAAALSFAEPNVIPKPTSVSYDATTEVRLDASQRVTVRCSDKAATDWVKEHFRLWFGQSPVVIGETTAVAGPDEGYRLQAKPSGVLLEAKTLQGVRYAMFTLRQIAERDSSGATVRYYRMPACTIEDAPALAFRGIHLCWFPEQSATLIEREIRTAAFYKYNHVVLESWGVFRSARHPWFGWRDGPMTRDVVRHLVAVAKDLGVTLVPQINVFGHASASRSCVGKHAALDFAPERQSLFEPAGGRHGSVSAAWNWCLSNPAAVETVRDLVVEMHEAFGNPPFFHIGCDEADEPTCANCRAADYAQLVCAHITAISDLLKARGARAMMWHDMLIRKGDPRWKGFYANGSEATAKLPQMLPKDVVVCDWYYGSDPGGTKDEATRTSRTGTYPTLDYFAKTCGLDTLTCPWEEATGIRAQASYACAAGLFGVLETTWHHFGGMRFSRMVQVAACGAWGRGEELGDGHFATVWRHCGWDMKAPSYREGGWYDTQVSRDILSR